MAPMFDSQDHHRDTMATLTNEGYSTQEIKLWKAHMKSSKTAWPHPVMKSEDKECLATFVSIRGFDTWTLWDFGSTTMGITPTFAQVANITIFLLLNPHILQLGTVGSWSTVNYGMETLVRASGVNSIHSDLWLLWHDNWYTVHEGQPSPLGLWEWPSNSKWGSDPHYQSPVEQYWCVIMLIPRNWQEENLTRRTPTTTSSHRWGTRWGGAS